MAETGTAGEPVAEFSGTAATGTNATAQSVID